MGLKGRRGHRQDHIGAIEHHEQGEFQGTDEVLMFRGEDYSVCIII